MRFLASILFVSFTLAHCYEEPEFLSQLQDDIDEYAENAHWLYSRMRRDADDDQEIMTDDQIKCKQQSKKSCCGKTNLFKQFADPDKSLGKTCYEEVSQLMKQVSKDDILLLKYQHRSTYNWGDLPIERTDGSLYVHNQQRYETTSLFSCDKYKMSKKLQYCISECIGKKKNILTTNGSINAEEMKKYLTTELFKEEWQKELAGKIVPKCLNEKYVEWPENEPGVKCNPVAVQFQHCLWKEYEMGCPRLEQRESKKCQKLRNHLKLQVYSRKKSA